MDFNDPIRALRTPQRAIRAILNNNHITDRQEYALVHYGRVDFLVEVGHRDRSAAEAPKVEFDAFGGSIPHNRFGSRRQLINRSILVLEILIFSTPHISSIERGQRQPSLEYAIRIAEALGVPIGYFCNGASITSLPDDTSYGGATDLPAYLQSFVMREDAQPYLAMAHRVSRLEEADYEMICSLVEMMAQRRRLKEFTDDRL